MLNYLKLFLMHMTFVTFRHHYQSWQRRLKMLDPATSDQRKSNHLSNPIFILSLKIFHY